MKQRIRDKHSFGGDDERPGNRQQLMVRVNSAGHINGYNRRDPGDVVEIWYFHDQFTPPVVTRSGFHTCGAAPEGVQEESKLQGFLSVQSQQENYVCSNPILRRN